MSAAQCERMVRAALDSTEIVDVHTHLHDPAMGDLLLSGIDELLTYHYHVAEVFRARPDLEPERFFAMPIGARADLVWRELFVERSPLSEVGRGLVTLLREFGLDPAAPDLRAARACFAERLRDPRAHVDDVLRRARVREVCMTNDPLDAIERASWQRGFDRDPRFVAALRLDSAIMDWPRAVGPLRALGYDISDELGPRTESELRRYLLDWHRRFAARYMAVSLPPVLHHPDDGSCTWLRILTRVVAPVAAELDSPLALMIGVRRQVNPRQRLAGDSVGTTDVDSIERLAADFPRVRFLVTLLAREGQHALCVAARKFANIELFGCWWFVNVPSVGREITAMRLDLLGPTFVPQHSDARVLEHLFSKWERSRRWLGDVFAAHYTDLQAAGGVVDEASIRRDLRRMLGTGFART
ncbi:MAG: glucuronate isomerase [Planctomycetota bacterium]